MAIREPAVAVSALRKVYGDVVEGYRRRSGGEVTVLGLDPETGDRALRERIDFVLQEGELGTDFTVQEAAR
jgi:ABC-2 type transport system ATP-binding protein